MSDTHEAPRSGLIFGLDLSQLLTLGGVFIAVVGSLYVGNYRLGEIEHSMEDFHKVLLEHQQVMERQIEYGRRLTTLEERFERLQQRLDERK